MEKKNSCRTRIVGLRLTPDEYDALAKQFKKSTSKRLSDFARRVLLGKPVTVFYRNTSLDAFMAEMIQLRQELNAIGNNFNQVVHKLHTLDHVPQFKTWLETWDANKLKFMGQVEVIKNKINEVSEEWLRS